jgi:hypothetical protein
MSQTRKASLTKQSKSLEEEAYHRKPVTTRPPRTNDFTNKKEPQQRSFEIDFF